MPILDINKFSGSLKTALQPFYLIHGEEELLRIEATDSLRAAAKQHGYLTRESHSVYDAHFDWQIIWQTAHSAGLFAEQKWLEIHCFTNKIGKTGIEILQQLAENPPENVAWLITFPKLERAQLQSKWFTTLSQHGMVLEAKPIVGVALSAWINERLQQNGYDAETDAVSLFAERVEGNLLAAKQELDKITLLYPQGHLITASEAEQVIAQVSRFDVFQLASAWMSGDARRTLRLLDSLQADNDEPVLLLWALTEDLRMLIRLTATLKQGKSVASVRNELRLWGDKQTLAPQVLTRISTTHLIQALQTCAEIDRQIKGVSEGNAWGTLRQLVMHLAAFQAA